MRRIRGSRHFPHRTMLVLAVLAVAPGLPQAGHHAVTAAPAVSAAVPASAAWASAPPVTAVTTAARQPAAPGGLCGVPGIGDIANLFGFCQGGGGVTGDLNNICQPSVPDPEQANSGIDAMVKPPASPGRAGGQAQPSTLYGSYGVAGQYWAATNLQCSDMTSLIGNNVASMVFDIAKSIDRVTITVYQSAAGDGILTWLTSVVDKLISSLGNAIYFPYLAAVVILGAIWLAWQGLIRKRGSRTIEGTIWMVVACAAAIWLIGRPADFTGAGSAVSNGISQTLNVAFAKLPAPSQSNCLPVSRTDPQAQPGTFDSSGSAVVDQNANELWTVLVCKPWLAGEFGTTAFGPTGASTPVNTYGRQLLWAQAIATNEQPTTALVKAKQATYQGIANSIAQRDAGIYPLFQGKQWTTRLELAFAALFAAAVAGVLVLLIAVTLILLKLGFLLLLVVGPFFLLIGTHPGFGRVVAMRWFEMLVGVLLKQGAVALVLSVLLYAYSLIMGTSDAALPWALKILMIALVTIAVFIYRRPFQHLFSAVGYGMIGSRERAEIDLERSRATLRANTAGAAAAAAGGFAAYRAARWARRNPARAASLAGGGVGSASAAGTTVPAAMDGTSLDGEEGYALANGTGAGGAPEGGGRAGARAGLASRARAWAAASVGDGTGRTAPPLKLPSRETAGSAQAGWARNGGAPAGTGRTVSAPGLPGTTPLQNVTAERAPRTVADAAAAAAAGGPGRPGQSAVPPGPGRPGRAGQADPVRARPASMWPTRSSGAPGGPSPASRAPSSPAPASPAPARPAPPGPAPAGPAPSSAAPAGPGAAPAPSRSAPRGADTGSPWRRGVPPRPAPARPPASPDPAPRGATGGQGGPWADSSAGRQAPPPPRRPALPARPASTQPPARVPARQPGPPARQGGEAPARTGAAPARPSAAPARDAAADLPLAGPGPDEPASPAPFWLRPIRRRK